MKQQNIYRINLQYAASYQTRSILSRKPAILLHCINYWGYVAAYAVGSPDNKTRKWWISYGYYLWFYSTCGPWPLFQFLDLYTVGRTPTGDQTVARQLPIHRTTPAQNEPTQTPMARIWFEPTLPMFEGAKAVRASDCAIIVTGQPWRTSRLYQFCLHVVSKTKHNISLFSPNITETGTRYPLIEIRYIVIAQICSGV
jgi:hypothetical protein